MTYVTFLNVTSDSGHVIPKLSIMSLMGNMNLKVSIFYLPHRPLILQAIPLKLFLDLVSSPPANRPIRLTQCCTQFKSFGK